MNTTRISKKAVITALLFPLFLAILIDMFLSRKSGLVNERGQLTVVVRNAPTIYYELRDEPHGFEYKMVSESAKKLGLELNLLVVHSLEEIKSSLESGKADIAAAGITVTDERKKQFLFTDSYYYVQQWVVCGKDVPSPKSMEDLISRELVIVKGSSYIERLLEIQREYPELAWDESDENTETLLHKVSRGHVECTVADSSVLAVNIRYYPKLRPAFTITGKQPLAWMLPKDKWRLKENLNEFLREYREDGRLKNLVRIHYERGGEFDYVDTVKFHQRIKTRLPKYREWFEQAAEKYGIEWELLAAQSYQESHWNPKAKSPTGVRGLMMLTLNTAKHLGVKNRIDPKSSIFGGAKHLRWIMDTIPRDVQEDDRLKYALAAYNVGTGHLNDAMVLAERLGANPNEWNDLSEVLPLLSRKKYYKTLKHGYARGYEPVHYVKNIINYHDILHRQLLIQMAEET